MSEDMIERVARAMFDVGHADAHGPDIYEDESGWWQECAVAAIAAMREPTELMACSGDVVISNTVESFSPMAIDIWRTMIDAALKSHAKPA